MLKIIFTARKRSLRRLCFHRCLSVHRGGCLPVVLGGVSATPPGQTPPTWTDTTHLGRHHPWADTPPPLGRHPPGRQFPMGRHPPAQCLLGYTPLPNACWDTPPSTQCMLGYTPRQILRDMVNKRAVRIPLECILVTY